METPTDPKRYVFQIDSGWDGNWVTQCGFNYKDLAMAKLTEWAGYLSGDVRVLDKVSGETWYPSDLRRYR